MFNPMNKVKTWLQMAAMGALSAINLDGSTKTFVPKDFTPKPVGNVKLNSHYNSKSARQSRQKRGY